MRVRVSVTTPTPTPTLTLTLTLTPSPTPTLTPTQNPNPNPNQVSSWTREYPRHVRQLHATVWESYASLDSTAAQSALERDITRAGAYQGQAAAQRSSV